MDYYAGIDVSLERSSVCVVDSSGKIVREMKVASEPEALLRHFAELGLPILRDGLEAGHCPNGCASAWSKPALTWCCWKRAM